MCVGPQVQGRDETDKQVEEHEAALWAGLGPELCPKHGEL